MGPILVVILDPLFGNLSNLFEAREDVGVQDFVTVGSIKSLDKGVLAGLAWLDIPKCNDPPVFAQVRLLFSMIDRSVPVFSCPGLDEAGAGCKTQSSH